MATAASADDDGSLEWTTTWPGTWFDGQFPTSFGPSILFFWGPVLTDLINSSAG